METLYPENFGAIGDGVADDTIAIQATIDAAGALGGSVILSRRYAISTTGKRSFGQYPNNNYSLLVNREGVHICGPGTLVLATPPVVENGSFVALAFGDGVNELKNVGCHGIIVDATALSALELDSMSATSVGCAIGFYKCAQFIIDKNIIRAGWGWNGAIQTICGTQYGNINANAIHGSRKSGIWIDGLRYSHVYGNRIWGAGVHGIFNATNSDISQNPCDNLIGDNIISGFGQLGIGVAGGQRVTIERNYVHRTTELLGSTGILIQAQASAIGNYPAQQNSVLGNVVYRDATAIGGYAIDLRGVDVSPMGGVQVVCDGTRASGNVVDRGWSYACRFGQSVINSRVVMNVFDPYVANFLTTGQATIINNQIFPNG